MNFNVVDRASLESIVFKAQTKAYQIESQPESLIWLVTLMEICHRNGNSALIIFMFIAYVK